MKAGNFQQKRQLKLPKNLSSKEGHCQLPWAIALNALPSSQMVHRKRELAFKILTLVSKSTKIREKAGMNMGQAVNLEDIALVGC